MLNPDVIESLAHQVRGMTVMYFLLMSVYLFRFRKDNGMMQMMFISTVCLCLGFLKDTLFVFDFWLQYPQVDALTGLMDLTTMLVTCVFFVEVVRPGFVRNLKVWTGVLCELAFIPLFLMFPDGHVAMCGYIFGCCVLFCSIVYMTIYAFRHKAYLAGHYSYRENLSVRWAVNAGILYILTVVLYVIAFTNATWLNEILFCLFSIIIWGYMFVSARSHVVLPEEESEVPEVSDEVHDIADEPVADENIRYISERIEPQLARCMGEEKLYLNPLLSLKKVAMEIQSNTKYLSIYLNRCVGMTFYDYVNSFRVKEACDILQDMAVSGRINMTEVAEKSGFNSISSFNRHFRSVMGVTPKEYYKKCVEQR